MPRERSCGSRARWKLAVGALLMALALGVASVVPASDAGERAVAPAAEHTFARAEGRRAWSFPWDHGAHPAYRLEWWYYTGVVRTAAGRSFGYQVTFFRQGLAPRPDRSGSAWRTGSLYLAHAAISDLDGGRYVYVSRTGRDSLGLSGAADDRERVWLGAWRVEPSAKGTHLEIADATLGVSVTLGAGGTPVLNGERGLDRKGSAPGQASWYASLPRRSTTGTLRIGTESWPVAGTTWMDHEFGTSQLGSDQVGWDWFGLRLDSGDALMLYRLRGADGRATAASGGTFIHRDGRTEHVRLVDDDARAADRSAATATPQRTWTSPASHVAYPLAWRVRVPSAALDIAVEPALDNQELAAGAGLPFGYWEGVVRVKGSQGGRAVSGDGYLELTGYSGDIRGSFR
jgi:predicted secreted hydrolase